jgi:RNA polymerase sigma-70 factor (ECF subfamily)
MSSPDFDALVDRFYPMLYRFALSLAHNEADAGDLTQNVFVAWARKGHTLRDPARAKSWLFTTLYRDFLTGRRRANRFPQQDIAEIEHELPCDPPAETDPLDTRQVMAALQELEETFRAPLVLLYLREHSYAEIAQIIGVPIGTVMSRISRGKQKLLRALQARGVERDGR